MIPDRNPLPQEGIKTMWKSAYVSEYTWHFYKLVLLYVKYIISVTYTHVHIF